MAEPITGLPNDTFLQLSIFGFQLSCKFLRFSVAISGVITKSMSFKTNKESVQVNDMSDRSTLIHCMFGMMT